MMMKSILAILYYCILSDYYDCKTEYCNVDIDAHNYYSYYVTILTLADRLALMEAKKYNTAIFVYPDGTI